MFVPVRSRLFLIIRLRGVRNLGWLVQASRSGVVIVKRVYYGGGSGLGSGGEVEYIPSGIRDPKAARWLFCCWDVIHVNPAHFCCRHHEWPEKLKSDEGVWMISPGHQLRDSRARTRQNQQCHRRSRPCTHSSLPSLQRPCTRTCLTTCQRRHRTPSPLLPLFSRHSPSPNSSTASGATKTTWMSKTGIVHAACRTTRITLTSSGSATGAVTVSTRQNIIAAARLSMARATKVHQMDGASRASTQ